MAGSVAAATAMTVATADAQVGTQALVSSYEPYGPQRVYDSRNSGGKLAPGFQRNLQTNQGPTNVLALALNVTATGTVGGGFLSLFPGDITWPGTSSLNWFTSNEDIANNAYVFIPASGLITVRCGGTGPTDFVIDIIGAAFIVDTAAASIAEFRTAAADRGSSIAGGWTVA